MKFTANEWGDILYLNSLGFGDEDYYSNALDLIEWVENNPATVGVLVIKYKGEIIAYLLWHTTENAIHTERRAVSPNFRGQGLGISLTKGVIELGRVLNLPYKTYAANYNLASINSSIKCGCKITKIGKYFTELSTEKRV